MLTNYNLLSNYIEAIIVNDLLHREHSGNETCYLHADEQFSTGGSRFLPFPLIDRVILLLFIRALQVLLHKPCAIF